MLGRTLDGVIGGNKEEVDALAKVEVDAIELFDSSLHVSNPRSVPSSASSSSSDESAAASAAMRALALSVLKTSFSVAE